jgi:hypothetical protein
MTFYTETIAAQLAELEADVNVSPARRELVVRSLMWKGHLPTEFLLAHGRDYRIGPDSFKLPRGEIGQCFMNATHLAIERPELTYVEGKVACHGIGIDHAWCVDAGGVVHDPTIRDGDDGHISDYFGVPFKTAYLCKAIVWNRYYGLLDWFVAGKTAPKLYELGLETGQQWVLDRKAPPRKPRKRGRPTEAAKSP